jgi:hypothetical protein
MISVDELRKKYPLRKTTGAMMFASTVRGRILEENPRMTLMELAAVFNEAWENVENKEEWNKKAEIFNLQREQKL